MSTQTQKHTKSRKRVRRGAKNIKKIELSRCPKCKKPVRKHTTCKNCGTYNGKEVQKVRVPKALRKKKTREEKAAKKIEKKEKKKEVKK